MSTSEKSTGSWLSAAVGRLFSSSKTDDGNESGQRSSNVDLPSPVQKSLDGKKLLKDIAPVNGVSSSLPNSSTITSTSGPKNLRYLSPSAIGNNSSAISLKTTAGNYRFNQSGTVSRKRQLIEGQQSVACDGLLFRDNVKRFRGNNGHSMIEEPSRSLFSERLDMSWGGGLTSFADGSPASSNRSLISRVSGAPSTTSSGLSSKTRAILNQLEKISTPAREARKLPMMRGASFPSERWAPMQSGITAGVLYNSPSLAPPLRRTANAVPSRIQLLSTSMAAQRKPYWRDIARKPRNEDQEQSTVDSSKVNGTSNANGSILHPIFDMGSSAPTQTSVSVALPSTQTKTKAHQAVIKGSDGKATSRNVFNTKDLENEDSEPAATALLSSASSLPKVAPAEGFLNDVIFSFAPPIERIPGVSIDNSAQSSDEGSDKSDGSDDEKTDDEDEVCGSGGSGVEGVSNALKVCEEKKESRPPTAADSETSAASASTIVTPVSSKNVSPLVQATKDEKSWDCPDCCITNKSESLSCAACGYCKEGTSKALLSNLSTFAKTSGGVSFGFAGPSKQTAEPSKFLASSSLEKTSSQNSPACLDIAKNQTLKSVESQPITATGDKNEEKRIAWSCPDCFISNEGINDKCQCCGYVKYAAKTEDSKSANAFGDRTFKPITSSTGVTFGFGTSAKSNAASGISFGLNATSSISSSSNASTTTTTFGLANDKLSEDKPGDGEAVKPVFGDTTLVSKLEDKKIEPMPSLFTISSGASVFGSSAKPPLFGLTKEKQEGAATLSLFNSSSPAPLLNSITSSSTIVTSVSPTTSSSTISTSVSSVFGSSVSSAKPLFGTLPVISAAAPVFGAVTGNEPAKISLFGQSSNNAVVSAVSSTPSSSAAAIFCPSSSASLGSFFSNTTTDVNASSVGTVPVPTGSGFRPSTTNTASGIFATTKPTFSIGSDKQTGSGLFGITADSTKSGLFGVTSTTTSTIFGNTTTETTTKPSLFGSNNATAPSVQGSTVALPFQFGSSTSSSGANSLFGGSNSSPAFGPFNTTAPSATPALSNSSSTNSLFSATSAESSKPFVFGSNATAPSGNSFQFGSATPAIGGATPFVFGAQSQPSATAAPAFGGFATSASSAPGVFNFGTEPVAPPPGGAFAFNATTGQRKVVSARRRLPPNRR